MPTWDSFEPDPQALRALRARLTGELLAKGLIEGSGKFIEVMDRKVSKAYYSLPRRQYPQIKRRFH